MQNTSLIMLLLPPWLCLLPFGTEGFPADPLHVQCPELGRDTQRDPLHVKRPELG